jgi:serine protease inhibitor
MNPQEIDQSAAMRAGQLSLPFAARLFGRAAAAEKTTGANVFVSPFSVSTALALTLEGAAEGKTAAQLRQAVGYPPEHDAHKLHHDVRSLITAVRPSHLLNFIIFSSSN